MSVIEGPSWPSPVLDRVSLAAFLRIVGLQLYQLINKLNIVKLLRLITLVLPPQPGPVHQPSPFRRSLSLAEPKHDFDIDQILGTGNYNV